MRKQQHSITSKLLTALFIVLTLSTSIFMLQYTRRVQGAASSVRYTIYEDGLASGWTAQSWAGHINLANTSPVYSGSRSVSFTPTRKGGRLYLYTNTAVDTNSYSFLSFAAQASQAGQDYNVTLYGGTKKPLSTVRLAHSGGDPVSGTWKVYNIPLSNLGANATQITGVDIRSRTRRHGTLYLDSISLTGSVSSPTATPTLTATPDPTLTAASDPTLTATPDPALMATPDPTLTAASDPSGKFTTLPPGSALPSDADCAARVRRSSWEPRPDNATANNTNVYAQGYRLQPAANGDPSYFYAARVTGNFTGTTDEIIQWAACKWGFDEDTVRAQAVQESDWHQSELSDCGSNTVPQTHGCRSVGILQVTGADIPPTFPGTWPYAYQSTAFNIDFTLAVRRACFEGKITWLGNGYHAGDEWGCIGHWFSGAWYDQGAMNYIAEVKNHLANADWLKPGF